MIKRIVALKMIVVIMFLSTAGRIGYIVFSNDYLVSDSYNSYTLTIDKLQPNIYYSNGVKITNNKMSYVAVVRPSKECINELNYLYRSSDKKEILNQLSKGYPVVFNVDSKYKYKFKYIQVFRDYYSSNICSQLVNKSSSGLLSYVDDNIGSRKINFGVDANGRLLSGDNGTIIDTDYDSKYGYTLTLDENVQRITYDACANMKNGCAVVMDVKTGCILACVTKPDDCYYNKPFKQYSVGSVFKVIVCACAIENNVSLDYECTGSIEIGDSVYSCQGDHVHGMQNMKTALANSCNCYFVNLALNLGADKLLSTANKLGFNEKTTVLNDWRFSNATLPSYEILKSKGQLALFGFGQGQLLSTPVQICSVMATVANNGEKNDISLIKSLVDKKGFSTMYAKSNNKSVISENTSKELLSYMHYVVTNGTGANANDKSNESAGKTATAQTGQYVNGQELYNTWFAGVYPYDKPKYAIVVMTEQGSSGAVDCCPIFRTIVEKLN